MAKDPRAIPPVSAEVLAKIEADLVRIPAGTLGTGYRSPRSCETLKKDPAVTIPPFALDKHEITREELAAVMGEDGRDGYTGLRLAKTATSAENGSGRKKKRPKSRI